ncbi:glycerate kinase [Hamadaea flava]|uniref:Glycerate kinase n=1 Tax=Hamadaea flava TaxID=1742688 RepID=A0ABV8LVM2_9ACTN|nr:glycerate kinase [Hamadaea flava]MCP2327836.1 glycerate kinase [Hamadaea flava]
MRLLICPDKFAGTLSAPDAAEAVAEGWRSVRPDDDLVLRPLADGGPGFVDVLAAAHPEGKRFPVSTTDPLGRPVTGEILIVGDTAYVESAHACGLHHLSPAERDPRRAGSAGLLPLLTAAAEVDGVRRTVIGLGGSATNDAGVRVLAGFGRPEALAAYAGNGDGTEPGTATGTASGRTLETATLAGIELIGATDVDNPLTGPRGASRVFGPQKGADPAAVEELEAALTRVASVLAEGIAETPGAGAAGGLGAAILALGGRLTSGIQLVRDAIGLDAELRQADLVITGEGSFDEQSLHGKVIDGVAGAGAALGVPVVVIAGRVTAKPAAWHAAGVTDALSLSEEFGLERALGDARGCVREMAARVAVG